MIKEGNRKRYIVFKIISDIEFEPESVKKAIKSSILNFFGELGISRANPRLLVAYCKKNQWVLQVNNNYVPKVKVALALIKEIMGSKVIIKTEKVYGTLKKIKQK